MKSHPRISELLVETGAYKDLEQPVILTSGELGIYYVNTEKLCQDKGEFEKYGDDSAAMIQHAVRMTKEHPTFDEVINSLTEKVKELLDRKGKRYVISGGQRRDWLFSGPVAVQLGAEHASVYKEGRIEIINPRTLEVDAVTKATITYDNLRAIHIADLLTEASSCYRIEDGQEKGWVPELRRNHIEVKDLVAVVTRLQGGERTLAHQGVFVSPQVAIDSQFLRQHSKNTERAVAYSQNPTAWSEAYLREHGALALIETFNPQGGKLDRARKFIERYENVLQEAGKWNELDAEVRKKYNSQLK